MGKRKQKLILIVSILLIAGFLATSLASYYSSLSSVRSQIADRELPLTCDNIYSEIQRDLLSPAFISSLMANDTFLRDWVLNGEKDVAQMTRYLKQIQVRYNTVTSFFVSEQTKIYYHFNGILKKVKKGEDRDRWYFRVRDMVSDYEINVDPDMANRDSMTIFINYKVYDYENHFIGAAGVGLTVSSVKTLIRKYQEDYQRRIYFADHTGKIPLHGDEWPDHITRLDQIPAVAALTPRILAQSNGSFRYEKQGHTTHLNTRYIPELHWYLLVEQDEAPFIKSIHQAFRANMVICAVITMIVLGLTNITLSSYQNQLEKMATTDKLTGIGNRQAFVAFFDQAIKEVLRKNRPLSLILFDIDHFKRTNDRFGHLGGDAVIQHIVGIAQGGIRASDILCRWGGEEFVILLKECRLDDAYLIAEKIRKRVEKEPAGYESHQVFTSISLGVGQYRHGDTGDKLLARVDALLYEAKKKGRNRTEKECPMDSGSACQSDRG